MNGETVFYATIAIVGTFVILGMAIWLRRRDKKDEHPIKLLKTYHPILNSEPTDASSAISRNPLYRVPEDLDAIIPIGSNRAFICEWDDKQQPKMATFRAKGGNGKFVKAIVVRMDGMTLFLRHKIADPIFQRPLIG
ncbi:MAG: hypothetical protein WCK10_00050 [Candidatus Staskawiczbacteria bacterium]